MIAALLLALAPPGGAAVPAGGPRATLGSVLLRVPGPAPEELRLDAGLGPTRLRAGVGPGERLDLWVPFLWALDRPGAPSAASLGLEAATVEVVPGAARLPGDWRDLPAALRGRPLPPLERAPLRPGPAQAAGLATALLAVLALRRRPALALAAGLAGAVLVGSHSGGGAAAPREVRVLEGDGESGRWLLVRSAVGRLALGADATGWLEVRPADRPLEVVAVRRGGLLSTACEAPGGELHLRRERVAPTAPGRSDPGGHAFRRVWVREPGEGWTPRGAWAGAGPLPPPTGEVGDPPGWLAAGLPQGVAVLVGELEGAGEGGSWLRMAPFEPRRP